MALNPPINADGQPMRVEGELFAVLRKDMEIEVKIQGWSKQTAKGKLFVTTARLVFVNNNHAKDTFKAFDVPLLNIYDEKFEQPIFGANYLYLKVKPLFGLIPGDATVKIWFMSGGCQKFLDIFLQVLPQIRKRRGEGIDPRFANDITNGNLSNKYAYVDPSDPSYVFVTQPNIATNTQMNQYYSQFPDANPNLNYAPPTQNMGQATNPSANMYTGGYPSQQQGFSQGGLQQTGFQQNQGQQGFSQGGVQSVQQNNYQPNQFNQNQNLQGGYPQFDNNNQYQGQTYNQPQNQGQQQFQGDQQQPQYQYVQQQQPNVGYYYGFWGPQLQNNGPR